MVILDTDCLSVFERDQILETSVLRQNLSHFQPGGIFTTIITFEEQMRGWLTYLARCKNIEQEIFAYSRLIQFLDNFRKIAVLDFNDESAAVFARLKKNRIRIGTMDLKIASIVLANNAILVTRNLTDFEQVPDLRVEDWTR